MDVTSQEEDPELNPDRELTIEFSGACGHLWMILLGDFAMKQPLMSWEKPKRRTALVRHGVPARKNVGSNLR